MTCNLGELDSGATAALSMTLQTAAVATISYTASVTSSTEDPIAINNSVTETTVVNPVLADLAVTINDQVDPLLVGEQVSYQINVTNHGPRAAENVTLTADVDASVFVVSAPGSCEEIGTSVVCALGGLASGAEVNLDLVVTTTQSGQILGTASVTATTEDPNLANNSASASTQVDAVVADVGVTLVSQQERVAQGQNITYQSSLTNGGPNPATNVIATYLLPNGVSFVSATAPCGYSQGTITCNYAQINVGAVIDLEMVVTADQPGPKTITANVTSAATDPLASNDAAEGNHSRPWCTRLQRGHVRQFSGSGKVGDVPYNDEDILAFDATLDRWSMYFDGSRVGLSGSDVNAFHIQQDGSILLSFDANTNIAGLGLIRDSDILKFTPTAHGALTDGSFEWFFDGSDVGLSPTSGDVDAISFTTDNRLVISAPGTLNVASQATSGADLLVLDNGVFGENTSGNWSLYFDGSDVDLTTNNLWGASVDQATGELRLTTQNGFSVSGINGGGDDVFSCFGTTGEQTSCTFDLWLDGSDQGVASGQSFDGVQVGSFTGTEVFGEQIVYMSSANNISAGGFSLGDEDIFYHDTRTGAWQLLFDGSDVGIGTDVNAFDLLDDGSILLSFNTSTSVTGVGTVLPSDIVRFVPTSTGEVTAGSFEMHFDGSDVGLTTFYEDVDAIGRDPLGNLLVSVTGGYDVGSVSGTDSDLLRFTAISLGEDTSGKLGALL